MLFVVCSPRSISKCGSSILCAVARVFTVLPAVGGAYYEDLAHGGFYCNSVGFGSAGK